MRARKQELGITYETISERSGVPLATVKKVLGGITPSPRYDTILALEKVLSPDTSYPERPYGFSPENNLLRETAGSYGGQPGHSGDSSARELPDCYPLLPGKRQGEYTEEDRDLLPDDVRTELIDGVLYDLASPSSPHQLLSMEISFQLRKQIEECGKDCLVFAAPSDVKISRDNRTIVQPDIYVVCDLTMIGNGKNTVGAPPFIVEILSPSTKSKDMLLKAWKYASSGVQEYWMVDPAKRSVLIHDYIKNPDGTETDSYSFDDTVPVRISDGHCSVDFKSIRNLMDKLGM